MNRPTDSVRVAIFDISDPERFLVVTEADDPDNWKLPGGKFEEKDTTSELPVEAAERELGEEIGVSGEQMKLTEVDKLLNDDGISARYIFAGLISPDLVEPTSDIARSAWFREDELPQCQNRAHILSAVTAARTKLRSQ